MLKILNFFKSSAGDTRLVTMRQRFEAAQDELNVVLGEMHEMPVITIDAAQLKLEITAPDQFADEALALPAPDPIDDKTAELADKLAEPELAKAS